MLIQTTLSRECLDASFNYTALYHMRPLARWGS
jgi:hypothetical protein